MPIDSGNLALKGLDDLFSTEENRQEEQREQVQQIPIDELHPFTNHPFKVLDDEAMTRTVESIAQYGVLSPLIARPRPEGGYEIISGHRRQHAAQLAGLDTLPVIVRQMDDDAAVLLMVDSNLQRENILPSERAFAYKMKLEAMKHQAGRPTQDNYSQVENNFGTLSSEEMAEELGTSKNQIFRYIRLTNLVPELAFDEAGLQKLPKVKELNSEFAEPLTKKKAAYPDYHKARNEMQELVRAQKNVERFFAEEKPAQENEQAR